MAATPTPAEPATAGSIRPLPLLAAIAIMLGITAWPHALAAPAGGADHWAAMALFWAMSAGFVSGVGFRPRFILWRAGFSGLACFTGIALAVLRLQTLQILSQKAIHGGKPGGDIMTTRIQDATYTAAPTDIGRRRFMLRASALPLGAAALGAATPRPARAAVKTSAHIVIAGSGLGGVAIANRLARELDGAKITIVDRKEIHNYQPGYTLVATGIWPVDKVSDRNADLLPGRVEWVKDMAAGFDPDARTVITEGGQRIRYDYLVVATGLHLDFAQIDGMDVSAIGANGLTSVYPGPQAAQATWLAMDAFRRQGGEALMMLPATPLKCAGAPLKMTFMLVDRLREAGTQAASKVSFHSALDNIFSVKPVNDDVLRRWADLDVPVTFNSKLVGIDIGARRATFLTPEGERNELGYDFIHVVPPMRAPDAVKNSPLAWQDGPFAGGGWLEVDKDTLRHRRYPNVFGLGDINGTPRGKTAATIKKSAPLVARNLIDVIAGGEPSQRFDGYTSCPLLLREGSALLVEFDYEGRLVPSLPMIEPLQDSYFAWLMKYRLLKPAYMAVAKGRV